MADPRCIWSNRMDPGTRPIMVRAGPHHAEETYSVCPAHEELFRSYYERLSRYGAPVMLAALVIVAGGLVSTAFGQLLVIGMSVVLIGLLFVVFPFATPQTIRRSGVRASRRSVRLLGVVVAGLGVYMTLGF